MTEEAIRVALDNIKEGQTELKVGFKELQAAFQASCRSQGERIGTVETKVAVLETCFKTTENVRAGARNTSWKNVNMWAVIASVIIAALGLTFAICK